MPIQINEVIIRALVDNSSESADDTTTSSSTGSTIVKTDMLDEIIEVLNEKNKR